MPRDEPLPWAKYLDGTAKPPEPIPPTPPEPQPNEFRIRASFDGEVIEFVVVREWRRGAQYQSRGIPAVGNDEIAVLKRATSGAKLEPSMSAAILRVKSILGGAIVAAGTPNVPYGQGREGTRAPANASRSQRLRYRPPR